MGFLASHGAGAPRRLSEQGWPHCDGRYKSKQPKHVARTTAFVVRGFSASSCWDQTRGRGPRGDSDTLDERAAAPGTPHRPWTTTLGPSLGRAIRCHGMTPRTEETRTARTAVRATGFQRLPPQEALRESPFQRCAIGFVAPSFNRFMVGKISGPTICRPEGWRHKYPWRAISTSSCRPG